MLKTGASLGISQSSIREISEANESQNKSRLEDAINLTVSITVFTSLIGFILSLVLSQYLSVFAFGNTFRTNDFLLLSFAVSLTILWEGQTAILKGIREQTLLAKSNIFGGVLGLIISVPIYLIFKQNGVIPVLIITPLSAYLLSKYFTSKLVSHKINFNVKELYNKGNGMIKMGMALTFTVFLSQLSTFLISSYLSNHGGLKMVGFYNAGTMIMVGYFSVVINALTTDYFPRISAINSDNKKLQSELNQQSIVSLLIVLPLIVLFLFLLPIIIRFLYSKEFYPIIDFVKIGIYGTLISICSNQIDLILVAKNNLKIYTIISIVYRILEFLFTMILYKYFGLTGLGYSLFLMGAIHMALMSIAVKKMYQIQLNPTFLKLSIVAVSFIFSTSLINKINNDTIKYITGCLILLASCYFCLYFSKKYLKVDFVQILKIKSPK
ncbi:MAG: hypothetical protein C4K58_01560 [Flavobacteriaceae bacterium]|nr:MAG: hypothetical protein C4K58_01560 [Flavobacteriaceae bacterium]